MPYFPHRKRPIFPKSILYKEVEKEEKPQKKEGAGAKIWKGVKRLALLVGFFVIISNLVMLVFILTPQDVKLPEKMVLVLEFKDSIQEIEAPITLSDPFPDQDPTLRQMIRAIEMAKDDDRIKGIVARMRDGNFALSQVQELRAAIADFKDSGKYTKIYSTSFGSMGGGIGRYYLASIFDELWMQPMGIVTITGINAEMPFFHQALEDLGVRPEFFQRENYKTAYESITSQQMSPYNREMMERLIGDLKSVLVADISKDRGIGEDEFLKLVDQGLFTSDEAINAGLLDQNSYPDIMLDDLNVDYNGEDGDKVHLISVDHYNAGRSSEERPGFLEKIGRLNKKQTDGNPAVALIHVNGAIMPQSPSAQMPVSMLGQIAAADKIAAAILGAANDDQVDTIVVRIDSPGGSPAASETILRALEIAKVKENKNIVVSMSSTAASGGYWVATNADHIFVLPTTITGSIGVLGGKFSLGPFFEKWNVNWDGVQWGENADMWSSTSTFDASGAERMNAMLDHIYENFLARVAKGRNMSIEEVRAIAGGRVWSGARAVELGLADEFGGLNEALDYAAELSGKTGREDIDLMIYPKPKSQIEQLLDLLGGTVTLGDYLGIQSQIVQDWARGFAPVILSGQTGEPYMAYENLRVR